MNDSTHVVIFHDKSKKFISQAAHDAIWNMSSTGSEKLRLGDNMISFSSIAKILTLKEFYTQYPDERRKLDEKAQIEYKNFNGLGYRGIIDSCKTTFAIESMIRGLKEYISSTPEKPVCLNGTDKAWYKGGEEPLELLKLMENKLKTL
jgi:hypothetical protein